VIAALGTTAEAIHDQTVPTLERGTGTNPNHVPFAPNVKLALEFALRSSLMLGDNHIGPEQLLAGLSSRREGRARHTDSCCSRQMSQYRNATCPTAPLGPTERLLP
jgi:hypothetical protein